MKYPKNTFHKLYLIEKEMYDRILPQLNAVDKQEIVELNAEHSPDYAATEEADLNEVNDKVEENVIGESAESMNKTLPSTVESNQLPAVVVSKTPKKIGIKKFVCDVCVDKKFTTKYSLKRHKENFHSPKQATIIPEVQENSAAPIQKFKRKREEEEEEEEYRMRNRPSKIAREEEELENSLNKRGIKRKVSVQNIEPRKKFRWENF